MKPKLILTDLDGTLLRQDKSLAPATRAALERAAEQGAEIVIATGRFFRGVPRELLELLEEEGPSSLSRLIARSESRSEVTAVFLALLDLCRNGKVCLAGTMEEPLISVL